MLKIIGFGIRLLVEVFLLAGQQLLADRPIGKWGNQPAPIKDDLDSSIYPKNLPTQPCCYRERTAIRCKRTAGHCRPFKQTAISLTSAQQKLLQGSRHVLAACTNPLFNHGVCQAMASWSLLDNATLCHGGTMIVTQCMYSCQVLDFFKHDQALTQPNCLS